MAKEGVIYASNVKRRTEAILRVFSAKNGLTFSQLLDILAHVVSGYDTLRLFDGKAGEYDPTFAKFDILIREYLEKHMPEKYYKIPVLQRFFGRAIKPITRMELEEIDRALESGEWEEKVEVPEVNEEEIEGNEN